jgi:UDP-glucose 4-epimerase
MCYLIPGGAGLIGCNMVDEILPPGHGMVLFDDFSAGKMENLSSVRMKMAFHRGRIADFSLVQVAYTRAIMSFISLPIPRFPVLLKNALNRTESMPIGLLMC